MTLKTNIKNDIRSELIAFERYQLQHRSTQARLGALVLIGATLFHLSGIDHNGMVPLSRAEISAKLVAKLNYTDKNETVRMPIKFDDGLRAIATTGV